MSKRHIELSGSTDCVITYYEWATKKDGKYEFTDEKNRIGKHRGEPASIVIYVNLSETETKPVRITPEDITRIYNEMQEIKKIESESFIDE